MIKYFIVVFFIPLLNYSQNAFNEYHSLIKQAEAFLKEKDYKNAAFSYHKAFASIGDKDTPNDRYNAACSWALANYSDSAFINLNKLIEKYNYAELSHISKDIDFVSLQNDPRWSEVIKKVKANLDKIEAKYNRGLMALIDSMKVEDQKWRGLLRQLWNNEIDSTKYPKKYVSDQIQMTDSLNYYVCKKIIEQYGYPNYEIVGNTSSYNFWLLLQHQDKHPSFQDSVLSKMKIEVDKGLANGSNYAYLVDRVKVNTGQLQIYGTQMQLNMDNTSYEPKPVIEPEKLNERRKLYGLGTIEDYIKSMNERYHGTLKTGKEKQ